MLLDSNIIIYGTETKYPELIDFLNNSRLSVSAISRVEVLGYHRLSDVNLVKLIAFFDLFEVLPIESQIINAAVSLRQQRKMSLGDAIIAGTAIAHEKTLVTRNVRDFQWIEGLRLYNPIND